MNKTAADRYVDHPKMSIARAAAFLKMTAQGVHRQLKNKKIKCPKLGNKSYITHQIAKQLFNLSFTKVKIASQIVKGGTGKTTSINHIAHCANTYGARVLLIDTDPQGNLTDANGVDPEEKPTLIDVLKNEENIKDCIVNLSDGLDLIPSRIENVVLDNEIVNKRLPLDKLYKSLLKPVEKDYDFILIDCPPTMGHAVTSASLYADIVLAPLNPDKFSAKGLSILKKEIDMLNNNFKNHEKKINYKVFLNKFSGKTILSDKAIVSLISDPDLDGKVLSTTIFHTQEVPNLIDSNKNAFTILKKSTVRNDFDQLTREVLQISQNITLENSTENATRKELSSEI